MDVVALLQKAVARRRDPPVAVDLWGIKTIFPGKPEFVLNNQDQLI